MTFQSDLFNNSEERDYFINPDCFGDDVCKFVIEKLSSAGIDCDKAPRQEDWGWYFRFQFGSQKYTFNCSFRPDCGEESGDQAWICFLECVERCLPVFHKPKKDIPLDAVKEIHLALASTDNIFDIKWHESREFDKNNEESGVNSPC